MTPVLPQLQLLLSPSLPLSSLNPVSPSALPPMLYPSAQCVFSQEEDQNLYCSDHYCSIQVNSSQAASLSILFVSFSPTADSFLAYLLACSWSLISSNLFFQKIHCSIENPFVLFQFFPASLWLAGGVPGLRQCAKIVFPQRKIHNTAKGTYTSSRGPCLWYALARLSGSTSKAPRKS